MQFVCSLTMEMESIKVSFLKCASTLAIILDLGGRASAS